MINSLKGYKQRQNSIKQTAQVRTGKDSLLISSRIDATKPLAGLSYEYADLDNSQTKDESSNNNKSALGLQKHS